MELLDQSHRELKFWMLRDAHFTRTSPLLKFCTVTLLFLKKLNPITLHYNLHNPRNYAIPYGFVVLEHQVLVLTSLDLELCLLRITYTSNIELIVA
mgnify:CR=1 FL=1